MRKTSLWATPILETTIANHEIISREMKYVSIGVPRSETGPHFNFADYFEGNDFLQKFVSDITAIAAQFTQEHLRRSNLVMKRCWLSYENFGDMTTPHVHYESVVSSVFYLDVPESAGDLFLYDPRGGDKYWSHSPWMKIKAEEGKLVLFPSYVLHSTKANLSPRTRFAFAADFTFKE